MELPIAAGCPGGPAIPTMICSPSVTRRAMFSPIRSAPSSAPPAALSASAIRAPGFSVTNPGCVHESDHADHDRLVRLRRCARRWAGRRNHLHRWQFGRHHRRTIVAHQGEHGHQHRDDTDRSERDDTGTPWVGPHGRNPARGPARRAVRQPSRQRRVGAFVFGFRLWLGFCSRAEPTMQTVDRQFGSHATEVRRAARRCRAHTTTRRGACG